MSERQPIFLAPAVVMTLLGVFLSVSLAAALAHNILTVDTNDRILELLVFIPARLGREAGGYFGGKVAGVTQFVTHLFVHGDVVDGDLTHLAINSAGFLLFGTIVARRIGATRFIAFFLLCGVGAALLFFALNTAPMLGSSGAISGLLGAALRFLYLPLTNRDADALSGAVHPPLLNLSAALTDWRIVTVTVVWNAINILVAWVGPLLLQDGQIAWEAHVGGFLTGFLAFGLFDPQPRSR